MNYAKCFFSGLIFEWLMPVVSGLLIAAFIWNASPSNALTHTTPITHPTYVHTTMVNTYSAGESNEAIKLNAPVKTGYMVLDKEPEVLSLAEKQANLLEKGYKDLMAHTSVSSRGQSALDSMGLTTNMDDTIMLLAKLIYSEAGPNKLDQLMAGSVVLNHVYSEEFPEIQSLIDAIIAPRHYACWPYMIKTRVPSAEAIESAKQVLSGEFPVPANIIFQAAFRQGTGGTFMIVDNKQYGHCFYNNYYCYNNSLSETDRYGNTAMSESELVALAEILHQQDISYGVVSADT